jgi:ubiquinol-cytochrome c reductase cytochrome c subunit
MPAANVGPQIVKKRPSFDAQQTAALAAYVASLAPGPAIPDKSQLDYTNSDIAKGGEIYRTNCAMCHNFAGSGGALTLGKFAPALRGTSPRHMYEAMITGPQSMPVFSDSTMPAKDKREIIAFLRNSAKEPSPGGLSLGKIGPVSEGGVGWLFGLGALIACAVWLGAKAR